MRVLYVLALSTILAPSTVRAIEDRVDAAGFADRARHHIGRRVVLDHCHLVYATPEVLTCVGIRGEDGSAEAHAVGRLLIHIAESDAQSRARALERCPGGELGEACDVSVAGEVFDASAAFGLDAARILGLRDATIRWPN